MKIALIIAVVVLCVGGGFVYRMLKGPDLSRYEHLRQPRITTLPDSNVLAVSFEASGEELKEVFGFLFKNYFKIKGVPKRPDKMPPPAARYENVVDFDMEPARRKSFLKNIIWKGVAAIPLASDIAELPDIKNEKLTAGVVRWQYGKTAEILHVGPYEEEAPTVKRLKKYIEEQGYEIAGLHEEVYLRGPGSPMSKSKDYYTIIRYPVKKK